MLEIGLDLLSFLLKSIIIVGSIIIVAAFLASLALKQKEAGNKFKFTNVSKKLRKTFLKLKEQSLNEKEAKAFHKKHKKEKTKTKDSHIYILDFNGDIKASAAEHLKKCITQVILLADPKKDEVLLRLESPGGMVSGYGLAASELSRLRKANIPLTISVDKVAASGGYLMSCVANKIISSPFAILGSIGVVASMPNFNKLLKKNHIDYEVLTAGEYKRTLTMFGENTDEARAKFLEQLEQIHNLFKNYVKKFRPQLDIDKVSTGEYWFGEDALELKLIDEIKTSEDYILEANKTKEIFHLDYEEKENFLEKFGNFIKMQIKKSPLSF